MLPAQTHAPTPLVNPDEEADFAQRMVAVFFEKFSRFQLEEFLGYTSSNWMLSMEEIKVPSELPLGLISQMLSFTENYAMYMIPVDDKLEYPLDMREVHQVIRELVIGIYVCNQLPAITLDANFDKSTTCHIPPAYIDTRIGQILISLDYMLKGLWHGAYMPKEKRTKFTERWRNNMDVNTTNGKPETKKPLLPEFISAGLKDILREPEYENIGDSLQVPENLAEFFRSHVDHVSLRITIFQKHIFQHRNLFRIDADWFVSSVVDTSTGNDLKDHNTYEKLNTILQLQETVLKENLENKTIVRKHMYLLRLISFLVPFLIAMKKRMSVPILMRMLPNLFGDAVKTEKELPPLMVGPDFLCKNFFVDNKYFNLHGGIQVDFETPAPEHLDDSIIDAYEEIELITMRHLQNCLEQPQTIQADSYPIPIITIDGVRYHVFKIEFETFYAQYPPKPKWVQLMMDYISKTKPKRLPVHDLSLHEYFKKFYGTKEAIKCKNLHVGLRATSERGLVAMFMTLCRKCPPTRLNKADETGRTLMHHAALNNHPDIITLLLVNQADINTKMILFNTAHGVQGPTPLHLAASNGALSSVSCLLAHHANDVLYNQDGWAPIHCAAFYDHGPIIRLMLIRNIDLLELPTKNVLKSSPLLLAASSGSLASLKMLMKFNAFIARRDDEGHTIIHLAALRFHTNIINYFIEIKHQDVPVWHMLVDMLLSESLVKKDAAVKCLEKLTKDTPEQWSFIVDSDGIPALVNLLVLDNKAIKAMAVSVLCNISEHRQVCQALTSAKAGPILISLLGCRDDDIKARAAIVLSDLGCTGDNQDDLVTQGALAALVSTLESELEDVLVNAVNAIRVLCMNHNENQLEVARCGGVEPLVEFLSINSVLLQSATAAAIAVLTTQNTDNQEAFLEEGVVEPIVQLINGHNMNAMVNAAAALQAMCENNVHAQLAYIEHKAQRALIKLLKIWSMEVKEQGACSLWALAGHRYIQQKFLAGEIGIPGLTDMLLLNSEKLHYVGCMGMMALGRTDIKNQNEIVKFGGIRPLVRLLRSPKTSKLVLVVVIRVLGTLCVGVAHKNNKVSQHAVAEERAIPILVDLMFDAPSKEVQVEVAYAISCIVLSNSENQERLSQTKFHFNILLHLLENSKESIQLNAGQALTMFAFANTAQQYAIRQAGGLRYKVFEALINSTDPQCQCQAAFQMVVLARVIIDMDQVTITARGVSTLIGILNSNDDNIIILTASRVSSLAHTRAGITDAMVTVGAIKLLIKHLYSDNEQVCTVAAIALGYLSCNPVGMRQLLTQCRDTPGLYQLLMKWKPTMSTDFLDEFRCYRIVGLPSLSLEVNGGPPAVPTRKRETGVMSLRPRTAVSSYSHRTTSQKTTGRSRPLSFHGGRHTAPANTNMNRVISAPAMVQRLHSAWVERRQTCAPKNTTYPHGKSKSKMPPTDTVFKSAIGAWVPKQHK